MKINKKYSDIPIKIKIPAVMLMQTVIPILVIIAVALFVLSSVTEQNAQKSSTLILDNVRIQMERYMDSAENLSQRILYEDDLYASLLSDAATDIDYYEKYERITSILGEYQNSVEHIENIFVMKNAMEVYESNAGTESGIDLKTFTMLKEKANEAKGKAVWITENLNLANSVYMIREIRNPYSKENMGLLVLQIKKSFISEICADYNDDLYKYTVTDKNKGIVYVSDNFSSFDGGLPGGDKSIFKYKDYTCFSKQSKNTGFNVIMFVPNDDLYYYEKYLNLILCILVLCVLSVLTPVIMYVVKDITNPVELLLSTMEKNKEGRIEHVKSDRKDEWGKIGEGFNTMIDERERYQALLVKKKSEAAKTRLKLLQSQINPHFMFNTLDSIKWLVLMNRNSEAEKAIVTLANILGFSMGKYNDEITVEREIENFQNFIYIKRLQLGDKYTLSVSVEDDVKKCIIPALTIQPFVENCFKHALSKKKKLSVEVKVYGDDEDIFVDINDDGKGIKKEKLQEIVSTMNIEGSDEKSGKSDEYIPIGIKNVNNRIRLKYGDDYGILIDSVEGEYTKVRIKIPRIGGSYE